MGKLTSEELQKLLSCIKKDPRVIVRPLPGYDSGVHLMDDKYLVVSTDPCVGVPEEWFGWLLIHYAASDVALFGAKPEFCTINLLGPLSTKPQKFQAAMTQACNAADELDMAIIGGHTGTFDCVSRLVGVCTAYGSVAKERLITPRDVRAGDLILCTKSVGHEVLVNLSLMHKTLAHKLFGREQSENLSDLVRMQSCVREALQLAETSGVNAMHDATEGGLVAALNEMAEASGGGFRVDMEKIPITEEVQRLQEHFKLSDGQVLAMSSTGTVLAAVDGKARYKVEEILRKNGVSARFLGEFTKTKDRLLVKNKKEGAFPHVADDPYNKILSSQV
ncbi:MAG: AIR synthase-related protein [Planctomycetota bacterium]|jgi:hydrogenase maturation factor